MLDYFRYSICIIFALFSFSFEVRSASFNCEEAITEAEIRICESPELSNLDEKIASSFFSINTEGRYSEGIISAQREWVADRRDLSGYDFELQLDFLNIANAANSCSIGENTFADCGLEIQNEFDNCMMKENYTTLVMNRCGSAYLSVLKIIDEYETDLWRKLNSEDRETLELFDVAYSIWKEFVIADCEWQYSEFRFGTIRGQIWLGCQIGHYKTRIDEINGMNIDRVAR